MEIAPEALGHSEDSLEAKDSGLAGARNLTFLLSRATSRLPETIILQVSITFSRLGNHHPVIGVFAQMYLIITRLGQCFNKYCFHGEHFQFTLEKSWCHPLHRNKTDSTYTIALAIS